MSERIGLLSSDLWSMSPEIERIVGAELVKLTRQPFGRFDAVLGWAGPRGRAARRLAQLAGVPFRALEVGPLRSVRPVPAERPLSLVLLPAPTPVRRARIELSAETLARASACLAQWRDLRLSWRNDRRDHLPPGLGGRRFTLVVAPDRQRSASASATLDGLLERAADENPGCLTGLVAESGATLERMDRIVVRHPGVVPIAGTNPHALFDAARSVYASADSALGRDAVLAGCPWGSPDMRQPDPVDLFARAFLARPVYLDPWSREPSDFEAVADRLAWLRDRFLDNDCRSYCIGVSRWKRRQVARFLDGPQGGAVFKASAAAAIAGAKGSGRVVVWETRTPRGLADACAAAGIRLDRMEDGFLRSVGLGAAFRPGASAVLDRHGIYYDPRRPSDLEDILATAAFPPEILARARALRDRIVGLRLSKYNVGRSGDLPDLPDDRPIVLVPGQVEDDASVLFGSPHVRGNLPLLAAARDLNPDAFVIFKPHPDVAAGLRRGRIEQDDALRFADRVVVDLSIADLLDQVDRVETMTSLTGFEALLRGKEVGVHGHPFYAGWGLTRDRHPPARRRRSLTLDELVAGALILYPRYVDPVSGLRCPPEILVDRLAAARDLAAAAPPSEARLRDLYVRARYALLGPLALLLRRARGSIRPPPPPADGSP